MFCFLHAVASVGARQTCVLDMAPIPGLVRKEDKIGHIKHQQKQK